MAENDGKIVIGIEGDPKHIKQTLDQVEKDGKKAAMSIGDAFKGIAAAVAGAGIFNAFKSAVDQANKLEASLNRVESAARSFGQSTAKAKEAAMALSKDGFLSLNQSASALSNLMATGLNVDQSKKFITAAKDISAFGNTIGDAAESIESGIKGILTGSSELVENMSPAMKTLSMRFTENKNKVGEAKAAQILYNDVVKLGARYTGDAARYLDTAAAAQKRFEGAVEGASAAIGKSLQPAFKSMFSALTEIVEGFTKWFSGLNQATQSLGVFAAGLAALVPVMLSVAALNPFAWVAGAVAGVLALSAAVRQLIDIDPKATVDRYEDLSQSLKEIADRTAEIEKLNVRTIEQNKELVKSQDELRAKAKELGVDYDALAKKTKNLAEASQFLNNIAREQASEKLRRRMSEIESMLPMSERLTGVQRFTSKVAGYVPGMGALAVKDRDELEAQLRETRAEYIRLYGGSGDAAATKNTQQMAVQFTETRFIEAQKKIAEIRKNEALTIAKILNDRTIAASEQIRRLENARADAAIQVENEVGTLRKAYAGFIEDKHQAEMENINEQARAAYRASQELLNADLQKAKKNEAEIAAAKERNAKRIAAIERAESFKKFKASADSFSETMQAATSISGGVAAFRRGDYASGFNAFGAGASGLGQGLSGMGIIDAGGRAATALKGFGVFGQVLGVGSALTSALGSLFGKSEEQRAREAQEQKARDEEAQKILELQAGYQKNMLALQEQAAKLPFENLQRKQRLIEIEAAQQRVAGIDESTIEKERLAKRSAAVKDTLRTQSGVIAGERLFGDVQATPDLLIKFLSERAAQAPSIALFMSLADQLRALATSDNPSSAIIGTVINQMKSLRSNIPAQLYDAVFGDGSADYIQFYTQGMEASGLPWSYAYPRQNNVGIGAVLNTVAGNIGQAGELASEVSKDTTTAENLLSVIEQSLSLEKEIADSTKKTADNTSRLTQMRETTVLDLAGGGLRGFGSFFRGAFNSIDKLINPTMPALSTPSAISNSLSIASLTRSWQERTADGIESLVKIQTEALQLLAEIALNSNRQGDVAGSLTEAELLTIMGKIRSRIV